jgi:hypothetical protein
MLVILKLIFMITLIKKIGRVCSVADSLEAASTKSLFKLLSHKRVACVQDERTSRVWGLTFVTSRIDSLEPPAQ